MSKTDKDAEEMRGLFQAGGGLAGLAMAEKVMREINKAVPKPKVTVTHIRHSSGRMSGSRNADLVRDRHREGTNGWHADQPASADVCYYCRERFVSGQLRCRIMNIVPSGWGPALLCMPCFNEETDDSCTGYGATRHETQCRGCGERINTIENPRRLNWYYCSNRCYQRDYRKRRHGQSSVVDWKGRLRRCQCCKESIDGKRRDTLFCSDACRQKMYRKRVAERGDINPGIHPHSDRPNWRPGDGD
jgi:hypothetical protein